MSQPNNQTGPPIDLIRQRRRIAKMSEGPLSTAESEQVIAEVNRRITAGEITVRDLAAIIACGRTTLSRILHHTYPTGAASKFIRRLRGWLDGKTDKINVPAVDYVPTSIGERIQTICDLAVGIPTIGVICTRSGCGKTSALSHYVQQRGPHRSTYIKAGQAHCTKRSVLARVGAALGIPTNGVILDRLYESVVGRLAGKYSGGRGEPYLIVIDEATTLRPNALGILRDLHDEPSCLTAIVLADTWRLDAELHSRHGFAGGYEQLTSRAKAKFLMTADEEIPAADVKAVATSLLAGLGFGKKQRLPAGALGYLTKLAAQPGGLRNVVTRLQTVHYLCEAKSYEPTYSVEQLDFTGQMQGAKTEQVYKEIPFAKTDAA